MSVELDHLFVLVAAGAPEADLLADLGVTEGRPNRHPGQGTACRRFFFANAYLELLWVEDPADVRSAAIRPLRFWERWSGRAAGASPFGLLFRAASPADLPFPTWKYQPPYFPPPSCLHIGTNSDRADEPLLGYFEGGDRPDARPPHERQPPDHALGVRELTAVRLFAPGPADRSPELLAAGRIAPVAVSSGTGHLAELGFDGVTCGRIADLRPGLPLILCW